MGHVSTWVKKNLNFIVTLITVPLIGPAVAFVMYEITGITEVVPIIITAALFTMIFIVGFLLFIYNHSKSNNIIKNETALQTEALNDHSLVTKTDCNSRVIYVNDKFLDATGYTREDLIGQSSAIYWSDDAEALLHELRNTLKSGQKWFGEIRIKTKSGKIIYTRTTYVPQIDNNGNLVSSIAIRTDITENKVATGDKNTRRALHILRDEIYMFEAGTLRFTYLNQSAMERCGWDESIYPQKSLFERDMELDTNGVYDIKAFYERARPLINGETEEVTHELTIDDRPSEIKMQLVRPEVGKPYFMTIVRDISDRHAFNKTKDDFISTVSHELRTPVTSIKGALGLILSGAFGELSEKAKGMLDIAYRNTDRLGLIINDILDLEKIAAGRMEFHLEPVDMATLIQDAVVENKPYSERYGVSMVFDGTEENVMCLCDKDRVFQVMNNLLSNAAKFSHKGSDIIINLEAREDTIYVSVEDFGAGIPNKAKATIFDRFTQADSSDRRAKGGTGLGLSIVKTLIEQQGGTIDFTSKWGKGTKFFFELPIASEAINADSIAAE
ncbi:MAG: PAS domain-containing sensor histidine kinase [Rhodobacteraceae bacterium]|nr:MAG: PAS domain-containing sensor histidine kinase [Paracoccaceae bacterium]